MQQITAPQAQPAACAAATRLPRPCVRKPPPPAGPVGSALRAAARCPAIGGETAQPRGGPRIRAQHHPITPTHAEYYSPTGAACGLRGRYAASASLRPQAAPSGRTGRHRATRGRPLPGHRRGDGTAEGRSAQPETPQAQPAARAAGTRPPRPCVRKPPPSGRAGRLRATRGRPLPGHRRGDGTAVGRSAHPRNAQSHNHQRMQNMTAPQPQPAACAAGTRPPRPCVRKPPPSGRAGRLRATRGRPLPGHRRGDGTAEGRSAQPETPQAQPAACAAGTRLPRPCVRKPPPPAGPVGSALRAAARCPATGGGGNAGGG